MGEKATKKIDCDKLRKAMLKRSLSNSLIQKGLGREAGYMSKILRRGTMTPSSVNMLKLSFGIEPDEYVVPNVCDNSESMKSDIESSEFDYGKLYQVIYNAVYTAVIRAWENE